MSRTKESHEHTGGMLNDEQEEDEGWNWMETGKSTSLRLRREEYDCQFEFVLQLIF